MKRIGAVIAEPITPIWIGGYNATAYSPELGILEPIRPTEIKGILRWMLRNLAFAAAYEKIDGREGEKIAKAERATIRFVRNVLGSASAERGGAMSAYVIRIEEPEGGFLNKDILLEIREKKLYVEKWTEAQHDIIKKYLAILERIDRSLGHLGISIYACLEESQTEETPQRATLVSFPYLDKASITPLASNEEKDIEKLLRSLACEMNEEKEHLVERTILKKYQLIKVITRYHLEPGPVDKRCIKILSIGDPRIRLASLGGGKEREARVARIFLIPPPAIDTIKIGVYRRRELYNDARKLEELDEIILRTLRLALILKGLGKATTRGYGSFEARIEGRSDELKDLNSIKEEVEDLKQKILEIIKPTDLQMEEMKSNPIAYIAFIDGRYTMDFIGSSFTKNDIYEKLNTISYSTLGRFIRMTIGYDILECRYVLGLPRNDIHRKIEAISLGKINLKIERRISYIWFRILKTSSDYRVAAIAFRPLRVVPNRDECINRMVNIMRDIMSSSS